MRINSTNTLLTLLALVVLSSTDSAHAAGTLFRSYLSLNGVDTNACTLTAPCRLLPAALAQTESGGEVWILDSANYNTTAVAITQSLTILAVPGALGSIVANSDNGITITADNVSVTLRNLVFRNLAGSSNEGVSVTGAGDALVVEGSEFSDVFLGIYVNAGGALLQVNHSTFRNNGFGSIGVEGTLSSSASGVIDSCEFVGATAYAIGSEFAALTVSNTNISQAGSAGGIDALGGSTVLLTNDVITNNALGVNIAGGIVKSSGNNTLDNKTNVSSGGTINKVAQY